MCYFLFFAIKH